MSAKNLDHHNRWRNKTVAFRVSEEESKELDNFVRLSGLSKQDYIARRLLQKDIVVQGNPRVYKALRDELNAVAMELQRLKHNEEPSDVLMETIQMIARLMDGMKEEFE